jgi:competence ComEA-like helix-hairpin-helix protein
MRDAEIRALRHAVVVLLAIAALRWAWGDLRPPARIPGPDVLPALLARSDSSLVDQTERDRPLTAGERVDPNHATATELDRLPGVGPAAAAAIVRDRKKHGPYRRTSDLERVPGLGPATVRKLAAHLGLPKGSPTATARVVDVNHADENALQTLPGIGPSLARRIVEARRRKPFASVDDLTRVRGIGPATVKRLRGRVSVHR